MMVEMAEKAPAKAQMKAKILGLTSEKTRANFNQKRTTAKTPATMKIAMEMEKATVITARTTAAKEKVKMTTVKGKAKVKDNLNQVQAQARVHQVVSRRNSWSKLP